MPPKKTKGKKTTGEAEPTGNQNIKGYEVLLKPIQDIVANDWQYKITDFLEDYLMNLANMGYVNFTEAALIIQNTCSYYCKRVDIMYAWVRQFCMSLSNEVEEESEKATQEKPKAKKSAKESKKDSLAEEELERLDLIHTANWHRTPIEKSLKPIKTTLLNTGARAPLKPGIACPVWQLNLEEMGYKDEFRICWHLLKNGRLCKDILKWGDEHYDYDFELDNCPRDNRMLSELSHVDHDNFDRSLLLSSLPLLDGSISHSHMFENLPVPFSNHKEKGQYSVKKVYNNDPYSKVIPFATLIIHRKFKKCNVFTTAKNETEDRNEIVPKKKKGKKSKEPKETYHLSFSELLGGKAEDMICYRMRKRQSERFKILHSRRKLIKNVKNAPELNIDPLDENEHHDDFDDSLGFLRDGEHHQKSMSHFNASVIEDAYKESFRTAHLKELDDVLTVQRRVADWHEMIQPALVEAEKRSEFDVHSYGTKILEEFNEIGEVKPLTEVIKTSEYKEVCRYVLSALMLSNTYNVEIVKSGSQELAKDNVNLKFLSSTRHHEELDANIGEAAAGTK